MSSVSLDVLIPVYNEGEVLDVLFSRLSTSLAPARLEEAGVNRVRFIFIDDGSTDDSAQQIADRIRSGSSDLLLRLARNFGHQAALTAGLDHATADYVAIIDADLQDPPELLPEMILELRRGHDVVYGQRRSRKEAWPKRAAYWLFYRLLKMISDVPVPVDAGDFCVMRQEVVVALRKLPEKLRFHRGLRSWVGFRQQAFPYERAARGGGKSKYGFRMLYDLATNGVASLSIRPLRITQALLFFSILITGAFFLASVRRYVAGGEHDEMALWFLSTHALVGFTASLQLFCLYILGAYVGRMYLEVKARPPYVIMETIGSTAESE
jgi:polyisoprenyl-phosphate glycosyltransferase